MLKVIGLMIASGLFTGGSVYFVTSGSSNNRVVELLEAQEAREKQKEIDKEESYQYFFGGEGTSFSELLIESGFTKKSLTEEQDVQKEKEMVVLRKVSEDAGEVWRQSSTRELKDANKIKWDKTVDDFKQHQKRWQAVVDANRAQVRAKVEANREQARKEK